MRAYWIAILLLGAVSCTNDKAVPCTQSSDCDGTLLCDTQSGKCVQCDSLPATAANGESGECTKLTSGAAPFCDASAHKCRACQADSDCPDSQVCSTADRAVLSLSVPSGQCVPKAQVAMVNSPTELQTAMTSGLTYLVLAANSYPQINVSSGNLVLIGPQCPASSGSSPAECAPQDLAQAATIAGVSVTGSASVKLDAVTISMGQAQCNGAGASLTLLRSAVLQSPSDGVNSQLCSSLIIERSRINGSNGAGIAIMGGTAAYKVHNSVIYKNQGASAITLSSSPTNEFSFNTVVDNNGVVTCNGLSLSSSIVVRNGTMGTAGMMTQFSNCTLTDVVVGTGDIATGTGVQKLMPDFMASGALANPYRLVNDAASMACCIDKLDSGPLNDYFGTARPAPAGGKYDIGFHEVMQ